MKCGGDIPPFFKPSKDVPNFEMIYAMKTALNIILNTSNKISKFGALFTRDAFSEKVANNRSGLHEEKVKEFDERVR